MQPLRTGYVGAVKDASPSSRDEIPHHFGIVIDQESSQSIQPAISHSWSAPSIAININDRAMFPSVWASSNLSQDRAYAYDGQHHFLWPHSALPSLDSSPSSPSSPSTTTSSTPFLSLSLPSPNRPRTDSFASSASSAVQNSWTRFALWFRFKMLRIFQKLSNKRETHQQQECKDRWTVTSYC